MHHDAKMTPERSGLAQAEGLPEAAKTSMVFELAFELLPHAAVVFDNHLQIISRNQEARMVFSDDGFLPAVLSQAFLECTYEAWATELRQVVDLCRPRSLDAASRSGRSSLDTFFKLDIF